MIKKTIIATVLLLVLVGALGFWYWNKNSYSKDTLKIEIMAPQEINFADEVEYVVKYKNNGNTRLEQLNLIFEFPEHTLANDKITKRVEVNSDELGDIYPGEEKTYTFKGRVFGKEGELKTANAWLSYAPKNLNARYESKTSFITKVKSVPLTFDLDLLSKIETNKNFDFSLNYYSALDYPLSNLTVKMEYPQGFEFLKSKPNSLSKSDWDILVLNKTEGGRIDVQGKITANLGDRKMFKAQLGMWRDGEFILLKEVNKEVQIIEPRIFVSQQINGQNNYIASPGDQLHYEIFFKNIGTEPFTDLFLVARLDGAGYDLSSIKTVGGQFKKGDNTVVWDGRSDSQLKFLDQGEEGKIEFWVDLEKEWNIDNSSQGNVSVKDTILISQIEQEFETKINSKVALTQNIVSNSENIYTIDWQVKNYFNNVKNVKVKAILPNNVNLTGNIIPPEKSSSFAFDSQSREIIWMVGDMPAGTGITNSPISISFQVQSNQSVLLNNIRISGEDEATGQLVEYVQ
jgi:hypothetical protein